MRPMRWFVVTVVVAIGGSLLFADDSPDRTRGSGTDTEHLFIMFSANAPRAAPDLFRRYLEPRDYARIESLPPGTRLSRSHRYVLPTTLRRRWADEPGIRHWVRRGCGAGTPGTLVYDPENWELTPLTEADRYPETVKSAANLIERTDCHSLGLAPGASLMLGLPPRSCEADIERASYERVRWSLVALVDLQAQRLLSDGCFTEGGLAEYERVVSSLAAHVRDANPKIQVVAQVSFRYAPPDRMIEAIRSVAADVDGIFFSYPTRSEGDAPCVHCSRANLARFLQLLRPG